MIVKYNLKRLRYLWSIRFWLAGPVTLIISILIMAAMSLWLPQGHAKVNHLVIPLVLFPFIWATVFFYTVLEVKKVRLYWVVLALLMINGGLVLSSIEGWL